MPIKPNFKTHQLDYVSQEGVTTPNIANILVPIKIIARIDIIDAAVVELETRVQSSVKHFKIPLTSLSSQETTNEELLRNQFFVSFTYINSIRDYLIQKVRLLQDQGLVEYEYAGLGYQNYAGLKYFFLGDTPLKHGGLARYYDNSFSFSKGTEADYLSFLDKHIMPNVPNQLALAIGLSAPIASRLKDLAELKQSFEIPEMYDYTNNSILKVLRTIDTKSLHILLRRHYRSHHSIINFSNQKYYQGKLIIENKEQADNTIKVISLDNGDDNQWNTAEREVYQIIKEIKKRDYLPKNVGVITPFRNQASRIAEALALEGLSEVKVGTVHTFQGGEKEHILFSASLTQNTNPKAGLWAVQSEELINVAVTRAKKKFTMVCDSGIIKGLAPEGSNDMFELYEYIKNNGKEKVNENADIFDNFIRSDDSYSEKEFYETISHFATTTENFTIKTKELIKDVIKEINPKSHYYRFASQAHFDFVLYLNDKRYMAFEINGSEHEALDIQKLRDNLKKQICKDFNFKLFSLPNHQTRRYDIVVDLIKNK